MLEGGSVQGYTDAIRSPDEVRSCRGKDENPTEHLLRPGPLLWALPDAHRKNDAVHQSTTFRTVPARAIMLARSTMRMERGKR